MTIRDYSGPSLYEIFSPAPNPASVTGSMGATQQSVAQPSQKFSVAVLDAAQQFLRDRTELDPRWRDPLAPPAERHYAVVSALSRGIRQARQGQAPPLWQALKDLPTTDEPTLLTLYNESIGWGSLQEEFDQPDVTEIKIIGDKVLIYPAGRQAVTVKNPLSLTETEARARIIAADAGMPLNDREPIRSLALAYGTRFTAVVGPRAAEPLLVFRRGRSEPWTLAMLVERESLSLDATDLLRYLLNLGLSAVVVGATGSGKTAILETLLDCLPDHIITVEDGAQELALRSEKLWTRQVVDVVHDQHAFRETLQAILRQTPRAVAVGECRGAEAGQILTLAMTDHQMLTTIHADSAAAAVRRIATLASMPGADYAGRFEDALYDAVESLPLVVTTQYWGQIGRRVITEIALATGVIRDEVGGLHPSTIPLVQIQVDRTTQAISWAVSATPNPAGDGIMLHNETPLPESLIRRLRQGAYRAWTRGETGQTPLERMQEACRRARALLIGGQAERALAETERAWSIRRDPHGVLPLVHEVLDQLPAVQMTARNNAADLNDTLAIYNRGREWDMVLDLVDSALGSAVQAAFPPDGGWEVVRNRAIHGGQIVQRMCDLADAVTARIARGASRETLSTIDGIDRRYLPDRVLRVMVQARVRLLEDLVARGEADPQSLVLAHEQAVLYQRPRAERKPSDHTEDEV